MGRRQRLSAFSIGLNRTRSRPEAILGSFEDMTSARTRVIFPSDARRKLCGKLIQRAPSGPLTRRAFELPARIPLPRYRDPRASARRSSRPRRGQGDQLASLVLTPQVRVGPFRPSQTRRRSRTIAIVRQLPIEPRAAAHSGPARRDALEGRWKPALCVITHGRILRTYDVDRQSCKFSRALA